ncbi:YciI family protein [Geomesophilobacter sediminis]|uniref:GTP cyclohydrolase n=1 Tax=Geomesophilobacter sediminis TaxID=2798584 RepID=A0A8J7IXH1_9BACT|nr:YciI family protein [Geomesophilobacter sediminis]MBJ6724592.1 GTP cyclohydrolase [Geomesophilobacter sediminis]
MFLIDVQYQVPLNEIDEALEAHVAFLREQYAKGILVASGRKIPRTGGIILARGITREQLDAVLEQDPFKARGLARYTITEFVASMTAPELEAFREP